MAFDVDTDGIESLWRPLDDDETSVAAARLLQAERRLRIVRPTLVDFIADLDAGQARTDLQDTVRDVIYDVVIRYLMNPDRYRQQSIGATGDVSIGFDVGGREAKGGVYFTDDDLAKIDAAVANAQGETHQRVVSRQLRTSFPYDRTPVDELPVIN